MGYFDRFKSFGTNPLRLHRLPTTFSSGGIEGKATGEVLAGERAGYAGVSAPGRSGATGRKVSSRQYDADSTLGKVARGCEILFYFVNLCISISQATFQAHWSVGPSARIVIALLVCLQGLLYSSLVLASFLLADIIRFFRGPERFFKQIRTSIILDSTQVALNLLLAAITTGSASSGGCKDASLDPHADKDDYPDALTPFCRDKRASAAFFWLSLAASGTTLAFCLVTFVRVRRSAETTAFTPPLPLAQEDAGAHFPRDADDEADPTWTAATAAGGRPSYDLSRADLDPRSAHLDAGGSGGGYRPSHDFADDAERLFAGHAPGYGVRDPFEDQDPFFEGRGETRSEAHSAGLDPYEAIRQSMDRPSPQRY
ncbi:hypothetical protein JCM8202v2_004583 [Rhodotorula sphaerocarpa]